MRTAPQETWRGCPTLASAPPPGHTLPLRGLVGLGRLVTGHRRQAAPSTPHPHAQVWTCPGWRLCSVTQEPGREWIQRQLVLWGPRSRNLAPSAWRGHRAPGQSPGGHAFRVGCRAPKSPPDKLHGEAEDTLQTSEQSGTLSLAAGGADMGAQMGGLEQASGRGVQTPRRPLPHTKAIASSRLGTFAKMSHSSPWILSFCVNRGNVCDPKKNSYSAWKI